MTGKSSPQGERRRRLLLSAALFVAGLIVLPGAAVAARACGVA